MMNKETKKNYIEDMKKVFSSNEAVMIAHYQGLNVVELDELRKELRENGILFKITKNRITKLAVKETQCKDLEKFFTGPTAAAKKIVNSDFSSPPAAAPGAAAATGAAAVTPHFSSNCFESSAASTTVSFDKSSIILFKSGIVFPVNYFFSSAGAKLAIFLLCASKILINF